ncbi:MAG: hypothetical protein LBT47_11810 [Deltaproteobacteria bacterium]|jgi:ABC-2 type transport system permease protein|nr:hypothetical protein [Deltaproteobacteria bacterium]
MIRRIIIVARSEFKAFWGGASGGLALAVFLGLGGLWFYNGVAIYALDHLKAMAQGGAVDASIHLFSGGLTNLGVLVMAVTPLTTMRAFAISSAGGHYDLLRALPLKRLELVAGLHLSACACLGLLVLLGLTPFIVLLGMGVGSPMVIVTAALGLGLLVVAFSAVGLAVSSRTLTSLASALTTLGVLGFLWAMGWAAPYLSPAVGAAIQGLAFEPRLSHFTMGVLDFNDLVYFLALTLGAHLLIGPVRD